MMTSGIDTGDEAEQNGNEGNHERSHHDNVEGEYRENEEESGNGDDEEDDKGGGHGR